MGELTLRDTYSYVCVCVCFLDNHNSGRAATFPQYGLQFDFTPRSCHAVIYVFFSLPSARAGAQLVIANWLRCISS